MKSQYEIALRVITHQQTRIILRSLRCLDQ
ncbi:hypothetical protein GECvBMG_gp103c [Salmonella phage GEC_vB_MG]|nr:hypothetical protein GECvBMG_gp103c [Salmonella phage GEC_vB_MG]